MPHRLSFQLYSARNFQPWDDVLGMVAKAGYREVEGFDGVYDKPEAFRAMMDTHGLTMPSGHFFPLDQFETKKKGVLHIAKTLGLRAIYCPFVMPEDRPKTAGGWRKFGKRLGAVAAQMRDEGYIFGWHNHDFEFVKLKDGSTPHERMFEGCELLNWEVDVAWIVRAKQNPVKWLKAYGDRITSAHVKDIAPKGQNVDQDGWCDVGKGTVKWPEIFKVLREETNCLTYVMEHDNPKDLAAWAKASFKAVNKM